MEKVKTTCVYCGTGCQIYLKVDNGVIVDSTPVRDRFNPGQGKLCIKGLNVHEFVQHPDRLKEPMIRKDGKLVPVSWDEAISYIASNFKKIMDENPGNHRVLACLASAKTTNEANYVMQKFARTVFNTNNVDHCARLCHASTVAGLAAAFGSGAMTNSIDEIADADLLFIIGSNTTEQHPLIGRQIIKALDKGAKLIVCDPRTIPLSKLADEKGGVAINQRPGTDVALLNGIMNVIITNNLFDKEFCYNCCEDFDKFKEEVLKMPPEKASEITGVPVQKIIDAAKLVAAAKAVSLIYSMGITQHTTGVDNVRSCANLQMLCGNLGRRATGVNPLRGQQNVQGACDVGALANFLPGYAKVVETDKIEALAKKWGHDFSKMDKEVGLTVVELMNEAAKGNVKGIYIMGENPMMSNPDINHVRHALENVFLVVQDIFPTPTTELADVVLPACSYAESDGTYTSTERRVQLIRPAIPPVGNSRPDWQIIQDIAKAMGSTLFNYTKTSDILDEMNKVIPAYGGITWERLNSRDDGLQWPCPTVDHPGTPFLPKDGKFTRGKGQFLAIPFKNPAEMPDADYPLILTTGRILWHYHMGTMSRRSKTLNERAPENFVEVNAEDAKKLNITNGEIVKVKSRRGEVNIKTLVTDRVKAGVIFMPFHYEESPANNLTIAALDPIAKIPEYKVCAVKIEKI